MIESFMIQIDSSDMQLEENSIRAFAYLDDDLRFSLSPEEAAEIIIAGTTISNFLKTFENYTKIPISRKNNLNKRENKYKNSNLIKFNKPLRRI